MNEAIERKKREIETFRHGIISAEREIEHMEEYDEVALARLVNAHAAELAKAAVDPEPGLSGLVLRFKDFAPEAVSLIRGPAYLVVPCEKLQEILFEGVNQDDPAWDAWLRISTGGDVLSNELLEAIDRVATERFRPRRDVRVAGAIVYTATAWGEFNF